MFISKKGESRGGVSVGKKTGIDVEPVQKQGDPDWVVGLEEQLTE